jgi:hypothetical protein
MLKIAKHSVAELPSSLGKLPPVVENQSLSIDCPKCDKADLLARVGFESVHGGSQRSEIFQNLVCD